MINSKKSIVYINDENLLLQCDKIQAVPKRASMVHTLISSYGLLNSMKVQSSRLATHEELLLCHSDHYLQCLKNQRTDDGDDCDDCNENELEFGLGYDCPKFMDMYHFAKTIAGGTLSAAEALLNGADIAINWTGGWHHAERDEAKGFCYINDIVIGTQKLSRKFHKILYIDLDVHHADGVENAFSCTKRILCLSFHQFESGFFPGTGNVTDCGFGGGKGYSINFPYQRNISGEQFFQYFQKVTDLVLRKYSPESCVIQCGGDVIAGDPLGGANLTPENLGKCITEIINWNLPTMFLGGGGYHLANTSRYWTYLTSVICEQQLESDIPDHEYFLEYGPDYEIAVTPKSLKNMNTESKLTHNLTLIQNLLETYHR